MIQKKRNGWNAPKERVRKLLEKDHPMIWDRVLCCQFRMDETYYRMLCQYLWQYIVYGTVFNFENIIMQNTLEMLKEMVDAEVHDVVVKVNSERTLSLTLPHNGEGKGESKRRN